MPKKHRAVEVIPDKLWITYNAKGTKTGTMSPSSEDEGWLIQYLSNGDKIAHDRDAVDSMFTFEGKPERSTWYQQHVFGYPALDQELFNKQEIDNLPCFTKTERSKVFVAAGYYGICFDNGGWMSSFCPKAVTLQKYPYIGPFKSETDMIIALKRKQDARD